MPFWCAVLTPGVHAVPIETVYDVDTSRTDSPVAVGVGCWVGEADGELDGAIVEP